MTMQEHEEEVRFQVGGVMLAGTLAMPERALGIVLFAHGSGSSQPLRPHAAQGRFLTMPFDLLTGDEEAEDLVTGRLRF